MKRGYIVTIAISRDDGKPRPAVVAPSDALDQSDRMLVAPFTSVIRDASFYRLTIAPSAENGLRAVSQVMVDKIAPCARIKCGAPVGRLAAREISPLNGLMAVMIGLAD